MSGKATPPPRVRKPKRTIASPISSRRLSNSNSARRDGNPMMDMNDDAAEKVERRRKSGLSGRRVGSNRDELPVEEDQDDEDDDAEDEEEEEEYDVSATPALAKKSKSNKSKSKSTHHNIIGKGKPPANFLTANPNAAQRLPSHQSRPLNVIAKPASNPIIPGNQTTNSSKRMGGIGNSNGMIQPSGTGPSAIGAVLSGLNGGNGTSIEVMSNNFEEWMKLATDNKITATNTWNFALIDYFADLTLLRNGPDDQSINFQKASATLDGCVKVWTSRVDSVATETGKLLSGLATGGDQEEREDGVEGEEGEEGEKTQKRKAHRSEATLAKSFAPLQVKKFDLEFTVDPLFKKTCADFDEGGAMGLLMNHLGVDGKGRVVFDAGDVEVDDADEEGEEGVMRENEDGDYVEIDKLTELMPDIDDLNERNISVTLADFKFTADPTEVFSLSFLNNNDRDDNVAYTGGAGDDVENPVSGNRVQDFFGGDDDVGGDFGGGGGDDFFSPNPDDDGEGGGVFQNNMEAVSHGGPARGPMDPFDPTRRGNGGHGGLVMAMMGEGENVDMMMDYFDKGLMKNWAGPEHWKLRRVTRKTDPAQAATAKAAKKDKTPFLIDFTSPSTVNIKQMFAKGDSKAIALPAAKAIRSSSSKKKTGRKANNEVEDRDEHLLPDDMHFSSRQLLTLFLKPKFTLKMRRQGGPDAHLNESGEVDENFWAQAAAEHGDNMNNGDDGDYGGESGPMPFETQFFHDDASSAADFAEVDDGLVEMDNAEEEDLWAASQGQLKKSKPESVQYAKRAKRVDVKRLKDSIWKGLDIKTNIDPDTESEVEPTTPKDDTPLTHEERTFDSVIQNLRTSYPQDKMSEISTSFCFICLLHLANEQGLQLEAARFDEGDGVYQPESAGVDSTKDRVVGELQALRITRDPTAVQAV